MFSCSWNSLLFHIYLNPKLTGSSSWTQSPPIPWSLPWFSLPRLKNIFLSPICPALFLHLPPSESSALDYWFYFHVSSSLSHWEQDGNKIHTRVTIVFLTTLSTGLCIVGVLDYLGSTWHHCYPFLRSPLQEKLRTTFPRNSCNGKHVHKIWKRKGSLFFGSGCRHMTKIQGLKQFPGELPENHLHHSCRLKGQRESPRS